MPGSNDNAVPAVVSETEMVSSADAGVRSYAAILGFPPREDMKCDGRIKPRAAKGKSLTCIRCVRIGHAHPD